VSSLSNLGNSFKVVQEMNVVPINRSTLIILANGGALPMVLLVVLVTPADDVDARRVEEADVMTRVRPVRQLHPGSSWIRVDIR
jgi:hypothetical protein